VTRHTRYTTAVVASLAVVLAGCGGGDGDVEPIADPTPTETAAPAEEPQPDEPDETEDPEPDDPFAIPDEIDEAYVQSVLDELFALRGEALRKTLQAGDSPGALSDDVLELVRVAHGVPARVEYADQLMAYIREPDSRDAFLPINQMGQTRYDLLRVLRADESCIVLTGAPDLSGVAVDPGVEQWSVTSLGRLAPQEDAGGINPTPWVVYSGRQLTLDGDAPSREDVENATYADVESLIELPCEGDGGER
jgi:hypothetical protein